MTARLSGYATKRLNEIVFPGTHDAGIYEHEKSFVKTQALNIAEQAAAGVRFFDVRIAQQKVTQGGQTKIVQKAYHLGEDLVRKKTGHQTMRGVGGWGGELGTILQHARAFVTMNPSEFLILKFAKSFGWEDIVAACKATLGNKHFVPTGPINLNTTKVGDLAGKVVTLFPTSALQTLTPVPLNSAVDPADWAFLPYYELLETPKVDGKKTLASKSYNRDGHGLQYFGKFSNTDKVRKNTKGQQAQAVFGGQSVDPAVMGMMYWTTTSQKTPWSLFSNIENRNKKMWTYGSKRALEATWKSGLQAAITAQMGQRFNSLQAFKQRGGNVGLLVKTFMPNIVMVDFAARDKCDIVWQLNNVTPIDLDIMIERAAEELWG